MKPILLLPAVAALATTVFADSAGPIPELQRSKHFALIVSDAEYATVSVSLIMGKAPIVVRDRAWIEQFAKVLGRAYYFPQPGVFGVSTRITFFDN